MDNNKVRIGARILSDTAINKLLPSNKNIMKQIENARNSAKIYNSERTKKPMVQKWDREFDRHFNNIFSILGVRGSGKTSVLLTMKYMITTTSNSDIILPLIVPEKMGKTSDVLGSLIGFLDDELENLKKSKINDEPYLLYNETEIFQQCPKKNITILEEKYNELLKQYMYTKSDYREILINQYEGFSDYINNAKNILDSDQKLIVKFEEFVEELLNVKRKSNKNLKEKEPLIFIFFDDVDLSTDRCSEILNVILRYLSHPNLIVFVTGNYRTFSEVLTINSLEKDKILNKQMEKCFFSETAKDTESALEVRKILIQDLLKKVLPPAFRYNMPLMDERSKSEFIFSTEEDNSKRLDINDIHINRQNMEYFSMIELIIKNFIDSNYKKKDYDSSEYKKSFLYYNGELLYAYFKMFDDTQRGTMNVYYFLYSILDSDLQIEESSCLRIKRLLSTLVQSSSILNKYENEINRIIDIRDNFDDTFVDYKYIESMLEKKQNNKLIDDIITIFMLANFIENIVVLENKKFYPNSRRKVHGANILCKILNSNNKEFIIYPNTKNLVMLLQMYTSINIKITSSNSNNISDNKKKDYFLGKYFDVIDELIKKEKGNALRFFSRLYFEDSKWVEKRIKMIMYHGGGKIIVLLENIKEIYNQTRNMGIDEKTLEKFRNELEQIIARCEENPQDSYIENWLYTPKMRLGITKIDILKIENLVENYKDKMLLYENKYKNSIPKYKVTEQFKEKYRELINDLDEIEESSALNNFENLLNNDYIYINDYEKLKKVLKNVTIQSRRFYPSFLEEKIIELNILIETLGKQVSSLEWLDYKSIVNEDEFIKNCIDYIKVKSLFEFKLRDADLIDFDKRKENFYKKFEHLKENLMNENNANKYIGFFEYIKEKERESRQVDLNV